MGNWGKRSRFRRCRSPLRWYSERHCSSSSSAYGEDDGIPAWEKKFCEVIGSVPWQKVVEASYFKSWYQGNVITWNDSACEETFHNAKRRFWSQVNGLPCDNYLPDPDLYTSEVNWDTVIDAELIMDLEQAYFAPPEDVKLDYNKGHPDKNLSAVEECHDGTPVLENQWKSSEIVQDIYELGKESDAWNLSKSGTEYSKDALRLWEAKPSLGNEKANVTTSGDCFVDRWETKDRARRGNNSWEDACQGSDRWDKSRHQNKRAKCSEVVLPKEYNNPWEAEPSCRTETAQDVTWRGSSFHNGWEDRGWGNDCWGHTEWRNQDLGNQVKDRKWRNKNYSRDVQEQKGYSPWKVDCNLDSGASHGYWQTLRASETKPRNWDVKQWSNGWVGRNNERKDLSGYNSNYKNSRSRRNDGQYVNARARR